MVKFKAWWKPVWIGIKAVLSELFIVLKALVTLGLVLVIVVWAASKNPRVNK